MTYSFDESKRIKALRRALVEAVPRFPNDKASLQAMEVKSLTNQLIVFLAWRLRHVGMRPRQVIGRSNLANDSRAAGLAPNTDAFLDVVQAGGDLTPYLSVEPRTKGYTPAAENRQAAGDSWADKDFLLNAMGFHHFHLGLTMEAAGHMERTNELIFAHVTRDTFEIIGLVDHSVFEREDNGGMTADRQALWSLFEAWRAANNPTGGFSVGGYGDLGVSSSGHPTIVTLMAMAHVRIMRQIDPKLEDADFVRGLYPAGTMPAKPKLEWHYQHLDFGLLDRKVGFFGQCRPGPN